MMMRLKLIKKKYSTQAHLNTQCNFTGFPLGSRKLLFRKLKGKENKSKNKNAKHIKNVN